MRTSKQYGQGLVNAGWVLLGVLLAGPALAEAFRLIAVSMDMHAPAVVLEEAVTRVANRAKALQRGRRRAVESMQNGQNGHAKVQAEALPLKVQATPPAVLEYDELCLRF